MKISHLPASLNRQKMIDVEAYVAPRYLLDLSNFMEGEFIELAHMLRPEFWKFQAKFLTPGCQVRVLGRNGAFDLLLTAIDVDANLGLARMVEASTLLPTAARGGHNDLVRLRALGQKAREAGPRWQPTVISNGKEIPMFKSLGPTDLKLNVAGNHAAYYIATIGNDVPLSDLFPASFWVHHREKLRLHDIVRAQRRDGSFDAELVVAQKSENGDVLMEPWPKYATSELLAATEAPVPTDAASAVVPIDHDGLPRARVQYLPATDWRVLGYDGSEVSRGHKSEAVARKALGHYLEKLRMRMPSSEELEAHKAEMAAKKAGTETKKAKA